MKSLTIILLAISLTKDTYLMLQEFHSESAPTQPSNTEHKNKQLETKYNTLKSKKYNII